jgi:hypothetical protein
MEQPTTCQFRRMEDGTPICRLHHTPLIKQSIEDTDDPPGDPSPWFCEEGQTTVYEPVS